MGAQDNNPDGAASRRRLVVASGVLVAFDTPLLLLAAAEAPYSHAYVLFGFLVQIVIVIIVFAESRPREDCAPAAPLGDHSATGQSPYRDGSRRVVASPRSSSLRSTLSELMELVLMAYVGLNIVAGGLLLFALLAYGLLSGGCGRGSGH